ncbi:hypothetical protein HYH03_013348 [Edaphochlamys debaryana]|uniref:MYND-type domain-containing protein n=1 Tax=Edaphochlamys debaryana TaxID=47281 RepID=A0A835XPW1_9CHLO|nr:hypothetical protein HYH03_013348 [Edaphochlamys debaryana]|eukprot:KAG2488043.1 hypothetical protein HYH03_013348 [Edaphochlamys debaryana]
MLERVLTPFASCARGPRPSRERAELLYRLPAPLWEPGFMVLMAGLATATADFAEATARPEVQRVLGMRGAQGPIAASTDADSCAEVAVVCAQYAGLACSTLVDFTAPRVGVALDSLQALAAAATAQAALAGEGVALASALAESQLLPAVAGAILRTPAPEFQRIRDDEDLQTRARDVARASTAFAGALMAAILVLPRTGSAAAGFAAALSHPDVVALQEGLAERLLVHGAVALKRGEEAAGSGEGCRWWLPEVEARLGHVINGVRQDAWRPEETGSWLEQVHEIMLGALPSALCARPPAAPPPARLKALEPRVLEAVHRLFCGKVLGGAYAPQPTWRLFQAPALDGIMEVTGRAESAAWGLALQALLAEAQLGGQCRVMDCGLADEDPMRLLYGMAGALNAMNRLAMDPSCAPQSLGASSPKELQAQLTRAGLAASLDHALRLAFTAADRAAITGDPELRGLARDMAEVPLQVGQVLACKALPLAARCGSGGALVTLAKRCCMMAQRLQDLEAAGTAEARREERELLAGIIHRLMPATPKCLRTLAEFKDAGLSTGGKDAGPSTTPGREALAFVGRSLCLFVTQVASRAALRRLSAPQLLACQPHRLLAAGCKLLCANVAAPSGSVGARPGDADKAGDLPPMLASMVVETAVTLAAHPQLSTQVRTWLEPLGEGGGGTRAAAAAEAAPAGADESSTRGCLEPLLREWVLPRVQSSEFGGSGAVLQSLLRAAAAGEAQFRSQALALAQDLQRGLGIVVRVKGSETAFYPGMNLAALVAHELAQEEEAQAASSSDVAALVAAPLPPPLAVPLAEAAFPGLRACANPACMSYGGRSEADLPLKHCSRCKRVRYCGSACQAAHWKAGHKHDCQAAGAAGAAALPS